MRHVCIAFFALTLFASAPSVHAETPVEKGSRIMKMNDDQPIFKKVKDMRFEEEANINPNIFSVEYMTRKWRLKGGIR